MEVICLLSLFYLRRFKGNFDSIEKTMALREESVGNSLAELYRFAKRTEVEFRHIRGSLKVKRKRSPYQIIDGCISCGSCKEACPLPIIEEGYPFRINSEECVGCDLCNKACPVDTCRPIYETQEAISLFSDEGVGLYSVPRRENIRKLIDLDLAQRLHQEQRGVVADSGNGYGKTHHASHESEGS